MPRNSTYYHIGGNGNFIDNERAARKKRKLAEEFKKQLEIGIPTNDDEKTIKKLFSTGTMCR